MHCPRRSDEIAVRYKKRDSGKKISLFNGSGPKNYLVAGDSKVEVANLFCIHVAGWELRDKEVDSSVHYRDYSNIWIRLCQ